MSAKFQSDCFRKHQSKGKSVLVFVHKTTKVYGQSKGANRRLNDLQAQTATHHK